MHAPWRYLARAFRARIFRRLYERKSTTHIQRRAGAIGVMLHAPSASTETSTEASTDARTETSGTDSTKLEVRSRFAFMQSPENGAHERHAPSIDTVRASGLCVSAVANMAALGRALAFGTERPSSVRTATSGSRQPPRPECGCFLCRRAAKSGRLQFLQKASSRTAAVPT